MLDDKLIALRNTRQIHFLIPRQNAVHISGKLREHLRLVRELELLQCFL